MGAIIKNTLTFTKASYLFDVDSIEFLCNIVAYRIHDTCMQKWRFTIFEVFQIWPRNSAKLWNTSRLSGRGVRTT